MTSSAFEPIHQPLLSSRYSVGPIACHHSQSSSRLAASFLYCPRTDWRLWVLGSSAKAIIALDDHRRRMNRR